MRTAHALYLIGLFLILPTVTEAQLLNRIRQAAEQGVSNAVTRTVEREVEKATQRQLEKAFEDLYGPAADNPSGSYDFSKIMKGINMNVPTEDAYAFTGLAEMVITGTDEKGKAIDPIKMKTFLNEESQYSAMEFSAADQKQKEGVEKTVMIFDMKNNASIILLENEGEKSRMAFGLDWQAISDQVAEQDSLQLDAQDIQFTKTGKTKTIAGHLCEEYTGETEEYRGSYWVSKEQIPGMGSFWGKNSPFVSKKMKNKNPDYFNHLPEGNILEFTHQSKSDKSTGQMTMVDIDPSNASTFVMAEYPSMYEGAQAAK